MHLSKDASENIGTLCGLTPDGLPEGPGSSDSLCSASCDTLLLPCILLVACSYDTWSMSVVFSMGTSE